MSHLESQHRQPDGMLRRALIQAASLNPQMRVTKSERLSPETRNFEENAKREDQLAVRALVSLCGITHGDAEQVLNLHYADSMTGIWRSFRETLTADHKSAAGKLRLFLKAIEDRETWIKKVADFSLLGELGKRLEDYSAEEIVQRLKELGAQPAHLGDEDERNGGGPKTPAGSAEVSPFLEATLLQGGYLLVSDFPDLCREHHKYHQMHRLENLRAIHGHIAEALRLDPAGFLFSVYRDELLTETERLLPDMLAEQPARYKATSFITFGLHDALSEPLGQFQGLLRKVAEAQAVEILKALLANSGEDRSRVVQVLLDILPQIPESVSSTRMNQWISALPPERRLELLQELSVRPESAVLAEDLNRKVRKHQITVPEILGFVLDESRLESGGKTLGTEVLELIGLNRTESAAFYIRNGQEMIRDAQYRRLRSLAFTHSRAPEFLGNYLQAASSGRNHLANLVLRLAESQIDSGSFKQLLGAASTLDEKDLAACVEIQAPTEMRRMILRRAAAPQNTPQVKKGKRKGWFAELVRDLERGENGTEAGQRLIRAHQALGEGAAHRLRQVQNNLPDRLLDFVSHIERFWESGPMPVIISSPLLFSAYLERLRKGNGLDGLLEKIRGESGGDKNSYRACISNLLERMRSEAFIEELAIDRSAEEMLTQCSMPRRIVICGGQYGREKREKICNAVEGRTQVEVCDIFNPRTNARDLSERDVLIWVTSSNCHTYYWSLKAECIERDVKFLHFTRSGYLGMVDYLRQLCGLGQRTAPPLTQI